MLTDSVEIQIISRARQKNVRDHGRSRQHFINIFDDFLSAVDFRHKRLMDLGPGQHDFGVLARERGAETVGIDNDPAVIELGRYKSFTVREGQIQDLSPGAFGEFFDGVFCKFSINCFWFWSDRGAQVRLVENVAGLAKQDGWSWIAPWNGVPRKAALSDDQISEILGTQADTFKAFGFLAFDLTGALAKRYGVHGAVANNALFIRNLPVFGALRRYPRL